MNIKTKKKAISPIVATALLVGMTIVMGMAIFVWARWFIQEQVTKFGQSSEQVCEQLSFDAKLVRIGSNIYDLYFTNSGNVPIHSIDLKKVGKGKSEIDRRDIKVNEGESVKEGVNIDRILYDKITIIPVILGNVRGTTNKKAYPCPKEYGKTVLIPS